VRLTALVLFSAGSVQAVESELLYGPGEGGGGGGGGGARGEAAVERARAEIDNADKITKRMGKWYANW